MSTFYVHRGAETSVTAEMRPWPLSGFSLLHHGRAGPSVSVGKLPEKRESDWLSFLAARYIILKIHKFILFCTTNYSIK